MITLEPTGPTSRSVRIELPPSPPELADRLAERLDVSRTALARFDARDRRDLEFARRLPWPGRRIAVRLGPG